MIPEEYDWQNRYIPRWSDSGAILNIRSLTNYEKLEPPSTNILDIL